MALRLMHNWHGIIKDVEEYIIEEYIANVNTARKTN